MKNVAIAEATITGRIVYRDGDGTGVDTFIPFAITIGDNCCEGHAESRAQSIIRDHIKARNEQELRYSHPEICEIVLD